MRLGKFAENEGYLVHKLYTLETSIQAKRILNIIAFLIAICLLTVGYIAKIRYEHSIFCLLFGYITLCWFLLITFNDPDKIYIKYDEFSNKILIITEHDFCIYDWAFCFTYALDINNVYIWNKHIKQNEISIDKYYLSFLVFLNFEIGRFQYTYINNIYNLL